MCLVEVNKGLVVSRAVSLMKSMSIFTESKRVKYGRESVLEFLLVNHPLDCPICDQAGECDSQDISLIFGTDKGRFYEKKKRAVDNFLFSGALIKTIMTRCIHRTRCVRFINEISTTQNLGVLSRGSSMEIGTYIVNNSFDALSANIIDLCPVGALTSMPYAFSARPWELFSCDTIDVMDSLGAAIRVDFSYNKIFRILPRLEETVNED
jgi:NADH dehydrogenase/NADH:ubiquinone oxidoreductase subunit G